MFFVFMAVGAAVWSVINDVAAVVSSQRAASVFPSHVQQLKEQPGNLCSLRTKNHLFVRRTMFCRSALATPGVHGAS